MSEPGTDFQAAVQRKGSLLQTIKAVAWSFLGLRKSADCEKDSTQLNPIHVIIAGLLAAAVFVVSLLMLVSWILSSGLAQPG